MRRKVRPARLRLRPRLGVVEYLPVIIGILLFVGLIAFAAHQIYSQRATVAEYIARMRWETLVGSALRAVLKIPVAVAWLNGSSTVVLSNVGVTATAYCNGSTPTATVPPYGEAVIPAVCSYITFLNTTIIVQPGPVPRELVVACNPYPDKLVAVVSANLTVIPVNRDINGCITVPIYSQLLKTPVMVVDKYGFVAIALVEIVNSTA